jgi:hypothetical protein
MSAPFYEPGRYACKVTEQALGEAKTGNTQFVLRFTVLGKVDPADPSRYIPAAAQYERTMYRAITEKTVPYLIEDLKTLKFKGGSFSDLDPNNPGFHDFTGLDFDGWCKHEKDQQGQMREKWGVARTSGPLEVKPVEPKKLRELDNLFGKQLKEIKPKPDPIRQIPVNAAESTGITDDDVPF